MEALRYTNKWSLIERRTCIDVAKKNGMRKSVGRLTGLEVQITTKKVNQNYHCNEPQFFPRSQPNYDLQVYH